MAGTTPAFLGKIVASRGDSLTASYNRFYAQRTQKSMAAVNKNFAALIQTMTGIAPDVLKQVLQPTLDLAQVYTPVDTGELVNSGRLRVTRTHQNPRVEIAFGGGAVNYAALVHEKTEYWHEPPTRSKYLQTAMQETLDDMREVFANHYRTLLRLE